MEKPTKFYSSKQETIVSEYLGWNRVSASGARPFDKGDIRSDIWLCECKTRTHKNKRYKISHFDWSKIVAESTSCMKRPIMVVDAGVQDVQYEVCILEKKFCDGIEHVESGADNPFFRTSRTVTTFDASWTRIMLNNNLATEIKIGDSELYVMPLTLFKEKVLGE